MMKKFTKSLLTVSLIGIFCTVSPTAFGQDSQGMGFAPGKGLRQVNFGIELEGYGLPVYLGMDFGVGKMVTIGPRLLYQTTSDSYTLRGMKLHSRQSLIIPSFRGDYHFSGHIQGLPKELDLYGGLTLGIVTSRATADFVDFNGDIQKGEPITNYDTRLWVQLGGRYYFNENWGVQLEFATLGHDGAIGMTYRF